MWELIQQIWRQMAFFVLHAVSGSSFPKPLSAAAERETIAAMKTGDRAARQRLIEHNLRLVAHVVKKYHAGAREPDDLVSIGTIGLIKAVDTFDDSKGLRLATYAARCIENEILMYFRAGKKSAQDVSLNEPIDVDGEGRPLTLMDVLAQEDTLIDDLETRVNGEKLPRYLRECLESRERLIISLRYGLAGEPLTQRQVARRLNISRSYVSRLETRALGKLRRRFERGDGCTVDKPAARE